jgi:aspartate kinase
VRDPGGGTRVLSSAAAHEFRLTAARHLEAEESLALAVSVKEPVSLLDINSTRMLGSAGFLSKVFALFDQYGVSVDVIATSEVSISTTLDPHYRAEDLEHLVKALGEIGTVDLVQGLALVTVVTANPSNNVLHTVVGTCVSAGIEIELVSHGASKVNMSFLVKKSRANECLRALHAALCVPARRRGSLPTPLSTSISAPFSQ